MKYRILHVVGGMTRAGTETWLLDLLRNTDREKFQMDFLVHTDDPQDYDDEVRRLGSRIIPCLNVSRPWEYMRTFKKAIKVNGPYDVVHSHVHHFSGFVMFLARRSGIPVRIAHSHLDTDYLDSQENAMRRCYKSLMKKLIQKYATSGIAVSKKAGRSLFGDAWEDEPRWQLLHCGIDLSPFHQHVERDAIRKELTIPDAAFVMGHVGRFHEQKNHSFLVDIAHELIRIEPDTHLLLVGDGPLRRQVEWKVESLGIADRVIFAGVRGDVQRLMIGAMDVFVLPSLREGLPLVIAEAQASGLPCVYSDVVTEEAGFINQLSIPMSLDQPAIKWAEKIIASRRLRMNQETAVNILENSSFNIRLQAARLTDYYQELIIAWQKRSEVHPSVNG